jgi:hypothetical protein
VSAVGGSQTDLYMFFSNGNDVSNRNLAVMTAENATSSAFGYEHRMFDIETRLRPATAVFRGRAFTAWTDYSGRPWIGRYSPGELVAYGDNPPAAGNF